MIRKVIKKLKYFQPRALDKIFSPSSEVFSIPEQPIQPKDFTLAKARGMLQTIVREKNPDKIHHIERICSIGERYNIPLVDESLYQSFLSWSFSLRDSKSLVNVLVMMSKKEDERIINRIIDSIAKGEDKILTDMSCMDIVKLLKVLDRHRADIAVEVLRDHLLKRKMDHVDVSAVLSLPVELLRKVKEPLEDILYTVPKKEVSLEESLAVIKTLTSIYEENIASELVRQYLMNAMNCLLTSSKQPESSINLLLETFKMIHKRVPSYYAYQASAEELNETCKLINATLEASNSSEETKQAFINTFTEICYKLEKLFTAPALGRVGSKEMEEAARQTLRYLKGTDYTFFYVPNVSLRFHELFAICLHRSHHVRRLKSILAKFLEKPEEHREIIKEIVSDEAVKAVYELLESGSDLKKLVEFVGSCVKSECKGSDIAQCSKMLELASNCILSVSANDQPITLQYIYEILEETERAKSLEKFTQILAKYLNVINSPCMNSGDLPRILNALKEAEFFPSTLASILKKKQLESEDAKGITKNLIAILYHAGDKEAIENFVGTFTRMPSPLLASLNSQEIFQLLSLVIRADVSACATA